MTSQHPGSYDRFHDTSIEHQYNAFLDTLAEPLCLSPHELTELRRMDAGHWITWSLAVLSGEPAPRFVHSQAFKRGFPSSKAQDLMCAPVNTNIVQTYDLASGELGNRFAELVATDNKDAIHDVNAACAAMTYDLVKLVGNRKPSYAAERTRLMPQTLLNAVGNDGATVQFKNSRVPNAIHKVVVGDELPQIATVGPGLSGEIFATSAIAAGARNVHFVSGGPGAEFVNGMIERSLSATQASIEDDMQRNPGQLRRYFPHMPLESIRTPRAHYYHEGMARGVAQLANTLGNTKLDAFVMSAVHRAGRAECLAAAEGAADLLAREGLFVLKLPQRAVGDFAGYSTIEPTLRKAFGDPVFIESSPLDFDSPERNGIVYPLVGINAIYIKK